MKMDSYLNYFFGGTLPGFKHRIDVYGLVWSISDWIGSRWPARYASCNAIFRMGCNHFVIYLGWRLNESLFYDYLYFYWHSGVGIGCLFMAGPAKIFGSRVYKISSNHDAPLDPDLGYAGFAMGRILTLASKHAFFTRTRWISRLSSFCNWG